MKSTRLVAILMLVAVCAMGWMLFLGGITSAGAKLDEKVAEADAHRAAGRYQLAVNAYQELLGEEDRDIYDAYVKTCEEFYADDNSSDVLDQLLSAYDSFVRKYPKEIGCWEKYVQLYLDDQDFKGAVRVLNRAELAKARSEKLTQQWNIAYYAYKKMHQNYEQISCAASFETYVVKNDTGWGTIDTSGKDVLNTVYQYMGPVGADGYVLAVTSEGEVRILDEDNVVYGRFFADVTEARGFSEGYIAVKLSGREDWCFLNRDGQEVLSGYRNAGMFQDGQAAVQQADGQWCLIDTQGQQVSEGTFEDVLLLENGAYVHEDDLSMFKISGKWHLYSDGGEDDEDFLCDGFDGCYGGNVAYCADGKWGFVDDDGDVVIEPVYDDARSFSGGVAAVCSNGKWGFIDENGTLIIDYIFTDVGYFDAESGTCPVVFPDEIGHQLICWVVSR